jgi:UDP-N-acetylglucosamine 2-epimerase (hydrolysing)
VREFDPHMLVIHGDRTEALAGAIVGALNNILVAHIEGGELSGTVDELLRHSISKLSHLHFVANDDARRRLIQMGEGPQAIFPIGSPEVDVMLSAELPALDDVLGHYAIPFRDYAIFMYHPVTTELALQQRTVADVVRALEASQLNFVIIYPNNDTGSSVILDALMTLEANPRFRLLPSLRFESFLTLLKNARALVGNSSAGVREAPVYGVPTVNIGSRQNRRHAGPSIINVPPDGAAILRALSALPAATAPSLHFGRGQSADGFMRCLKDPALWATPRQKQFRDVELAEQSR